MTDRVNWIALSVFTLGVFALGCLAGVLVFGRNGPEPAIAAERAAPGSPPSDVTHGTEVDIAPAPAITSLPPAPPAPPSAPPRRPAPSPRAPARPEMVYPVPLPAPVAPSPAGVTAVAEEQTAPPAAAPAAVPITEVQPIADATLPAEPRVAGLAPLEPPQRINKVPAKYPKVAEMANVEGTVVISATIDTEGKVTYPKIVKSIPALDKAAIETVSQWEFKPATRDGHPVPVVVTLSVEFALR
jgi:protein TonB